MVVAALLLAMAQPTTADLPDVPTCSLVTPRGDVIGFFIWSDDTPNEIRLSPTSGSAWPVATVVGSRRDMKSNPRFTIGGRDGFILDLSVQSAGRETRAATLLRDDSDNDALPLAYGYCDEQPPAGEPPEPGPDRTSVGADHPTFDPDRWPDSDCGLILSDGRRMRLAYRNLNDSEISLQSPELWSGRLITAETRLLDRAGRQTAFFNRGDGLQGVRAFYAAPPRGATLIRFESFGDPSLSNVTGYGLCGYRLIIRRPSR